MFHAIAQNYRYKILCSTLILLVLIVFKQNIFITIKLERYVSLFCIPVSLNYTRIYYTERMSEYLEEAN